MKEQFPRVSHVWVDQGYTGEGPQWIEEHLGWTVEVVQHPRRPRGMWVFPGQERDPALFVRAAWLPRSPSTRALVVERTFAWMSFCHRLCKDYELLPQSTESWIYACMIRFMTRRLARASS